ncbi:condensation domain-containing protein [Massilia sp. B-10]|nr:condensation domain-containing protein [Massilia sp. B-10]
MASSAPNCRCSTCLGGRRRRRGRRQCQHHARRTGGDPPAGRAARTPRLSTLFMALLAAYQVMLHRHSGQEKIIVGSPMPGRSEERFDRVVGDFVNPIALQADFSGAPSAAAFLQQVRDTVLEGMEHQDLPFGALVEQLQVERGHGRHPVFQTMFVLQNALGCRSGHAVERAGRSGSPGLGRSGD